MVVQDFPHGITGYEDGLAVQALGKQVPSGVFCIRQVDVADMVHNLSVDHLAHVLVPAAVARLHMENGNLQPLCADGRQGAVGVAQYQEGVGLLLLDHLVTLGDDVAHRLAQGLPDAVKIVIGSPHP